MLLDKPGAPIRTVGPTAYPVTLAEAKEELDILDDTTFDAKVTAKLEEAIDQVERDSRRCLMPQTWQMYLDRFYCREIELLKFPVQSVTFVKYYAGSTLMTLSATQYEVDLITEPTRICPVISVYWPVVDYRMNAIQIEWIAGYANAAAVPPAAKAAVKYALKQNYHGCEVGDNYWSLINRIKVIGYV